MRGKWDKEVFRSKVLIWLTLVILLQVFFLPRSYASPFAIPEKFIYDLTWSGLKAGTATLELRDEGDRVKIVSIARSASWVSVFYTVDDRVESTLFNKYPEGFFLPSSYRLKIREGRHRRDKEVTFNHGDKKAFYVDYLKNEKREFEINSPVFDPLSGFYYLRTLQLAVDQPVYITIFDSKKVWDVEVQVVRKEKITLATGTVNTIVVKPLMKSEGIFSRKGELLIWLTDDGKRIPVKMQTKVAIGSVTATLVHGLY